LRKWVEGGERVGTVVVVVVEMREVVERSGGEQRWRGVVAGDW